MNKQLLSELYKIHAPSMKEQKMAAYIEKFAARISDTKTWRDKTGNVYIVRGVSETYPCVVAHMDQVQRIHSNDFTVMFHDGIVQGYSPSNKRFEGLGADDKNGIYVALECLSKFPALKCAFFVGEEIGCIGSEACDLEFFDDCRFVLQCDRRNGDDLITDIFCRLCSPDFLNDIQYSRFGYKTTDGLITDVGTLKDRGLQVSCVNMSCGYYNPHTDYEFTVLSELENCENFVMWIIENCTNVYPHDEGNKSYTSDEDVDLDFYDTQDEFEYEVSRTLTHFPGTTADELLEWFSDYFPDKGMEDYQALIDERKSKRKTFSRYYW